MPRPKKPNPFEEQVIGLMTSLHESMQGLAERVNELEKFTGPKNATEYAELAIQKVKETEPEKPEEGGPSAHRLDPRYRAIVDEVLGKQFPAWEEYEGTSPGHFRFTIQVPDGLNSTPKETHTRAQCEHDKGKCLVPPDLRTRIISLAENENGVRQWCKMVRENLNKFYGQQGIQTPFTTSAI